MISAGQLNRRIQVQRATRIPNGAGGFTLEWSDYGAPIFAMRRDVSDRELFEGGRLGSVLMTRFTVRSTAFTKTIRRTDRIVHEGMFFGIEGIKEVPPGKAFFEITAQTGLAGFSE
ncbi:head-tail adaptor protein [Pseudaestuariivita rosea]|uniref:head-tail adaptor protein n=1 Tax=Pseudaestuariivita rosea TaxID=2763263 RepID=UPI001ABB69B3|nr:head-tail adaptor protein [Pseudaestuariivita rosea]